MSKGRVGHQTSHLYTLCMTAKLAYFETTFGELKQHTRKEMYYM